MKSKKLSFELISFYLGASIGSIVYLSLVLEMMNLLFSLDLDIRLASIIAIALGCVAGTWFFLYLSARIGQIIGLLIWKYFDQTNVKYKTNLNSVLTVTAESNFTTHSNVINFPKQRRLKVINSAKVIF